jgi:cell division protein FtsI (penicillin-binding protein 3)
LDAPAESQATNRLRVLARICCIWGFVVLGRLIYLQLIAHDEFVRLAESQQEKEVELRAPRGEIFDRNGARLAMSLPVDSVCVNPLRVPDIGLAADLLSRVLEGVDRGQLRERMKSAAAGGRGFLWVKRKITPEESEKLRSYNLDWVEFRTESRRFYPKGPLAAHVIGSVDHEEKGNAGVEQTLNQDLMGRAGIIRTLSDVRGGVVDRTVYSDPQPGKKLVITIDERIQYFAERELRQALIDNHCRTGSLVVMNPTTGEILAIANAMKGHEPFDPNKPVLAGEPIENRQNLAVSAPFEPGSVFKVVTISAGIDTGRVRPETVVNCGSGRIVLFRRVIHDAHPYSALSVSDVLAKSSNIGAIQVGLRVGNESLYDFVKRFGFGSETGVPLPGESAGLVWPLKKWIPSSIGSVAMGHEVMTTTLQLAQACSIVANGGMLVRPRLVIERQRPGASPEKETPTAPVRAIKAETAATMRALMQGVVLHGTGRLAQLEGYSSAGKTGSAQIYDHATRVYTHKYNASFMGFAPVNRPAIVVVVSLNGASKFGGPVAGPVFAKVASAALRFLDVPKDQPDNLVPPEPGDEPDSDLAIADLNGDHDPEQEPGVTEPPAVVAAESASILQPVSTASAPPIPAGPRVPDFHGKTVRAVLEEAMEFGIKVEIKGSGMARIQDPPAGSVLRPDDRVRVVFAR